jgi:hypothetical protein
VNGVLLKALSFQIFEGENKLFDKVTDEFGTFTIDTGIRVGQIITYSLDTPTYKHKSTLTLVDGINSNIIVLSADNSAVLVMQVL